MSRNIVLFNGYNANHISGLWITDGTSAGTSEIPVSNASSSGLIIQGMTAFGNKALFDGRDANDFQGLWVTDGTSAARLKYPCPA